jgi:hypothetical protein
MVCKICTFGIMEVYEPKNPEWISDFTGKGYWLWEDGTRDYDLKKDEKIVGIMRIKNFEKDGFKNPEYIMFEAI